MRVTLGAMLLLALAIPQPALAQQTQPRTLAVPATAAWQHAETGMILPPASAGLTRGEIRDSTDAELDVVAGYSDAQEGVLATVYLYRTTTPDVALWFDRALTAIMLRPEYRLEGAALPAPAAFARPGISTASGLRAALDVNTPDVRSTSVAIVPLGPWLLKIRLSASGLDRAALDERLTRFIAGLRWPAETATTTSRIAVPVEPCPAPLRLRNARIVRSDMSNTLMDALAGSITAEAADGPPPVYCREAGATLAYGVYRPDAATNRYLIALGDAGIALSVGEAMDLSALLGGGGGGRRFSVTMLGRNETSVYPSFNRLPPPEQALAAAGAARNVISVSTGDRPDR